MTLERIFAVKVDAVVRFILAAIILTVCALGVMDVCFAGPSTGPGMPPAIGNGVQSGPGFAPVQRGAGVATPEQPSWSSATYALSLDGVDDYAVSSLNAPTSGPLTVMVWFRDEAPTKSENYMFSYCLLYTSPSPRDS